MIGHDFYLKGLFSEAVVAYTKAIVLNDKEPSYYFHRATAFIKLCDLQSSLFNIKEGDRLAKKVRLEDLRSTRNTPDSKESSTDRNSLCFSPEESRKDPQTTNEGNPNGRLLSSSSKGVSLVSSSTDSNGATCQTSLSVGSPYWKKRGAWLSFTLGQCYLDLGFVYDAMECFQQSWEWGATSPTVLLRIAFSLIATKEYAKAIRLISLIIKEDPRDHLLILRAKLYQTLGEFVQAFNDIEKLIVQLPNHPDVIDLLRTNMMVAVEYKNSAAQCFSKRQFEHALYFQNISMQLHPQDKLVRLHRGISLMEMGHYQAAMFELCNLLQEASLNEYQRRVTFQQLNNVYYFFGLECICSKEYLKAISVFLSILDSFPEKKHIHCLIGDCYLSLQIFTEALYHYEIYLTVEPNNQVVKSIAAVLRAQKASRSIVENNLEDAIKDFGIAMRYEPTEPFYCFSRGRLNILVEDITMAVNDLEKALQLKPDYQEARGLLSQLVEYGRDMSKVFVQSKNPRHQRSTTYSDDASLTASGSQLGWSTNSTIAAICQTRKILEQWRLLASKLTKENPALSHLPLIPTYLGEKARSHPQETLNILESLITISSNSRHNYDPILKSLPDNSEKMNGHLSKLSSSIPTLKSLPT